MAFAAFLVLAATAVAADPVALAPTIATWPPATIYAAAALALAGIIGALYRRLERLHGEVLAEAKHCQEVVQAMGNGVVDAHARVASSLAELSSTLREQAVVAEKRTAMVVDLVRGKIL